MMLVLTFRTNSVVLLWPLRPRSIVNQHSLIRYSSHIQILTTATNAVMVPNSPLVPASLQAVPNSAFFHSWEGSMEEPWVSMSAISLSLLPGILDNHLCSPSLSRRPLLYTLKGNSQD